MFPLQLLQQQDAMKFQRHRNRVEALQANLCLLSEKSQAEWFELYKKTNQEICEKSAEIASLIVVSPPVFSALSNCYLGCGFVRTIRHHEVRGKLQPPRRLG